MSIRFDAFRPQGTVSLQLEDGTPVLYLQGDIDGATVSSVDERSWSRLEGPVGVVDASALTYINSEGVALLLRLTEPARSSGLQPELREPPRILLRLLELTGLHVLFRHP